ncbi:separin protein, partial [Friedmanniomyces endolithicus]
MLVLMPQVEVVKADLASGSASTATVSELQRLLTTERTSNNCSKRLASKPTTTKASSGKARKASVPQPTQVHEDATEALSPKAVYALATEVVNITFKVLTSTAKSRTNDPGLAHPNVSARAPVATTTPASRHEANAFTGPLEPRSGNSTPVRLTMVNKTGSRLLACRSAPAPDLVSTAECARLAFAYLRSAPAQKLSASCQSGWQLEMGMMVFATRLVALGLDGLAVKELRVLKRRLQPSKFANEDGDPSVKTTKTSTLNDPERETLASLLRFQDPFNDDPEALGLAISHQLLVLKIIAGSRKPAVIKAVLEHLRLDQPGSPASLMIQQAATPGGSAKSARQLEVLAQSILSLCPSASAQSDVIAMDSLLSPCPHAVLELQVLALRLRQVWWKLADHRNNLNKELVEPFSKVIAAFMRRVGDSCKDSQAAILERLREQPTGHTTDYDFLLCELVRVAQSPHIQHDADFLTIIHLAAGFAQRYARSYPGRNARSILAVIQAAIRQSRTADEMQHWVTQDAVRVYIHSGTLVAVADGAARMSMTEVWLLSTDAIALDRILQALVLRSLRHTISDAAVAPFDDETLPSGQRGVLLEKLLCHALNSTGRSKYRAALQKLIPDILSRLATLYVPADYPLRRARTATIAFCLRESHPELLPPHAARVWCDEYKIAEGVL